MQFDTPAWKAIDKLIDEQQLEAARKALVELRTLAAASGNHADWTRALIREVQLTTALGSMETAVRELRAAPWPNDALSRLLLDLYYADTLINYVDQYSWEINQRERVSPQGGATPVDLKLWTRAQIVAEALGALARVWHERDALSGPADVLGPYLQLNNYPAGIRDTLRDVVSYHAVELLGNTSYWSPAQNNEMFRLDHAALLQPGPGTLALDDAAQHPLLRALSVLDDLQAWHSKHGRAQAALEAQLERLRRLHAAFTQVDERAAQAAALSKLLSGKEKLAWWPMGQVLSAQWAREAGELVRAHQLAEAGAKSSVPDALTASCRRLLAELEAPGLGVEAMLVDGARKRSLSVEHRNIKQVYFRAYASDLSERLERIRGWELMPDVHELRALLAGDKPVAEWSVSLPDLGDYDTHTTYVTPPLDQLGYYHVIASARADFSELDNQLVAAPFFVSQLTLRHRSDADVLQVNAFDGESGLPARDVSLTLYGLAYNEKPHVVATASTDAQGLARVRSRKANQTSCFLVARRGNDAVPVLGNIWLSAPEKQSESVSSFVFTDRSVYRPNQTLQWKVLAYRGRGASWKNLDGRPLTVNLHDANGQQVQEIKVKTNAYGTAAGSFTIPPGRALGAWSVRTSLEGLASVRVEEYKRPTFEVSMKPLAQAARLNHPAELRAEAKYYFGLPVQGGRVAWKVEREERYPYWWRWWRPAPRASQVVASGAGVADAQGVFKIAFTPASDPKLKKGVQLGYRVSIDVTDEGGETRSASRSFVLGQVAVDARLELESGFVLAGSAAEVALTRTNLDGDALAGKGRYRVIALRQPDRAVLPADRARVLEGTDTAKARTPGDELRSRVSPEYDADQEVAGWLDGRELQAGEISTDAAGKARISLPPMAAGAYRIRYVTQDDYGEKLEISREWLVADSTTPLALASVLKLERSSVSSGGSARVLAGSGLPGQALWLEIAQDGELIERRWLPPGAPQLQEIAIGPAQRGGLSLTLVGVRDYQSLEQHAQLFVPWDDRQLALELSTFRDLLRPGARETFRVTVRGGPEHSAVAAAELLAYMYDRSLDVFAAHTPPQPSSLYPDRSAGGAPATWGLGSSPTRSLARSWYSLPDALDLRGDTLDFPRPYLFGGPGARHAYALGVGVRSTMGSGGLAQGARRAPAMRMALAAPAPAAAKPKGASDMALQSQALAAAAPERAAPAEVRENFAETAFFKPSLLTDADGNASIEFTVPDSLTEWNVWVHAITRDFRSGSISQKTRSVKDLLVRPYLPRFVREADEVALKVLVQNAGEQKLDGQLTFELFDPKTQESLVKEFQVAETQLPFSVGAHGSANLTIALRAPRRVGDVAVRVVGQAGELSDGELRPLPLLPSRLHLIQSKLVTLRGDGSQRTLALPDLAAQSDLSRTNEQLVVSVEAQLFMTVLKALPFLIDYPYECSEQTLNRFLSAAIVSSVFEKYPAVKSMAQDLVKQRSTLLEKFDAPDPNRTTQLEESPWLQQARGVPELDERLIKVLDPQVAARERERALSRLQKMQLPDGGFPWFPGGPPSTYMTVYLLVGLARASEFDVQVPRDMVARGWQYLASDYAATLAQSVHRGEASPELITFMAFALNAVPDASWLGGAFSEAQRKELLDYAFARWTKLPPLLKSVLTITLLRAQRRADAERVFASVMDSAKSSEDEGTFWQPEDRAWLWYNDRIETHALALRALLALDRNDPKVDGLVVWLLLNKKLNQWKSTRATAEVIFSLVKYLEDRAAIAKREIVTVALGRTPPQSLVFEPTQYRGKAQIRVPGPEVSGDMATTVVSKQGPGVAFASVTWHYATDELPAEGRGDLFAVKRSYYRREGMGDEAKLVPLADGASLHQGDEVEVQLEIKARAQAEYIHLRDPRPAGLEPPITVSGYHYDLGLTYYEEVRDSAHNFFIDWLPAGEYTLKYRLRANLAGQFRVGPASLQSMYAPEFAAFSAGHRLQIQ